jgi:hypothetical protein
MKIRSLTRDEPAHALISRPSDEIPRDVMSCNLVARCQRFGGICFFRRETGKSRFLRNVSSYTTRHYVIRCSLKQ